MYIYGDILIAVNFIMNGLILVLTAYITGINFSLRRIGAAAFLGSLYALGEVERQLGFLYIIPLKLAAAAIIIYLAFGYKTGRSFLLTTIVFFIVSFVLAGAVIGWAYFLEGGAIGAESINFKPLSGFGALAAGGIVAVGMFFFAGKWLARQMLRRKNSYLFTLKYKDREFSGVGFLDTGNSLYSPIGKNPVVLLTKEASLKLLPPDAAGYLEKYAQDDWISNLSGCRDGEWLSRLEIIPYSTVGHKSSDNLLLGFRPDNISIFAKEGEISSSKVVVAITSQIFDKSIGCSALLHPMLLNELNLKKGAADICALPGQR